MELYFVPEKMPRTMTRKERREIDRWRRVTVKQLRKSLDGRLMYALLCGSSLHSDAESPAEVAIQKRRRAELIEEAVRPPLLMGPYMNTVT
jgi:hypothetical protein